MNWNLEVVTIPVSDVDRAKAFYADKVGFVVDLDTRIGDGSRLVQLTPPGSACSIHLNSGIVDVEPGSARALHLVVSDVEAARAGLVERGVDASEVRHFDFESGEWVSGPDPERRPFGSYVFFSDPDGNGWVVQEHPARG
jgi:catechol 2,3-dioxygenase-like lactoylglutathione lyase family enzyme